MSSDSPDSGRPHLFVSRQVENLFKKHGDTHTGLGYPKPDGYQERQKVFLDVMRFDALKPAIPKVFDIGCATGILLDYYVGSDVGSIHYRGVDLSGIMLATARKKHPNHEFIEADPFERADIWSWAPDYVIMGGLFMWRASFSELEWRQYMLNLIKIAFNNCKRGIVFNVMSKHVDWERGDLFHVPFDELASTLGKEVSRNYIFRADYGLYEYTTYVYH
jgi:SAM-dependent methyltransferase